MKDFQGFLARLVEDRDFQQRLANQVSALTNEQALDVMRVLLVILRAYDEYSQE